MVYRSFWLPKSGNANDEYEDAFAGDSSRGRFAIADGATESSFADSWARLLVNEFVREDSAPPLSWVDWLPPVQRQWVEMLAGRELPWHAEIKVQLGAFATFLGLALESEGGAARWSAVAVGDSCLFHVREDRLICAFPISRSNEFGTRPSLVGSRSDPESISTEKARLAAGHVRVGDEICLMTDALAQWFLRRNESGEKPWETLRQVSSSIEGQAAFALLIADLRQAGAICNDDVTLVTLGS